VDGAFEIAVGRHGSRPPMTSSKIVHEGS
jgi:hypothetical protein